VNIYDIYNYANDGGIIKFSILLSSYNIKL